MTDQEAKDFIRSYMKQNKITYQSVASIVGKSKANICETLTGNHAIRYATVYELLAAMQLYVMMERSDGKLSRRIPLEIYDITKTREGNASFGTVCGIARTMGYATYICKGGEILNKDSEKENTSERERGKTVF